MWAPSCCRRISRTPAPPPPLPPAFPLRTSDTFKQHLQPRVVRRQRVGGDAAARLREDDFERVDINQTVLARVLEVARVGVGF